MFQRSSQAWVSECVSQLTCPDLAMPLGYNGSLRAPGKGSSRTLERGKRQGPKGWKAQDSGTEQGWSIQP